MREILLNELAKRGVFTAESLVATGPTFPAILKRLAKTGTLFYSSSAPNTNFSWSFPQGNVSLSQLLPIAKMSPFHHFFIEYCIDKELTKVLNGNSSISNRSNLIEQNISIFINSIRFWSTNPSFRNLQRQFQRTNSGSDFYSTSERE